MSIDYKLLADFAKNFVSFAVKLFLPQRTLRKKRKEYKASTVLLSERELSPEYLKIRISPFNIYRYEI